MFLFAASLDKETEMIRAVAPNVSIPNPRFSSVPIFPLSFLLLFGSSPGRTHQVDIVDNQEYGLGLTAVPSHDSKINLSAPITLKLLPPIASCSPPQPLPALAGPPVVTSSH